MPIHEYKCEKCDSAFEKLVFGNDVRVVCDSCGSEQVEKQFSTFSAGHSTGKTPAPCNSGGGCPASGMAGTGCSGGCPWPQP